MKTYQTGWLAIVMAGFALLPQCLSAQKLNLPLTKRSQEPNGMRSVLMEYPRVPSITLMAVFPSGKAADPPGASGIAEMMATLMRRGTATRTANQISEEIDFLGGSLGIEAGTDSITVSLSLLTKDLDAGLDLFADVIRNAQFPEEELNRERQLAIAGLQSLGEEPRAVAAVATPQLTYAGHPYGGTQTLTSLGKITRDALLHFYTQNIAPNQMILTAVGDFKAEALQAKLRAKFADWKRAEATTTALPKVESKPPHNLLIDKPDATQTQVRLLRPGIPVNHPDHFAAAVANTILGGGFTSRLTDEIRVNRSLTYGIGSNFQEHLLGGVFQVSTFTKVATTKEILKATREVLQKTADQGFSEEELRKVKGYMAGLFAISAQTPSALAGQLATLERNGLPKDYLTTYIQKIQAVTLADVNRVAKTYFKPDGFSILLVAPASKIQDQIKPFGAFETKTVESLIK